MFELGGGGGGAALLFKLGGGAGGNRGAVLWTGEGGGLLELGGGGGGPDPWDVWVLGAGGAESAPLCLLLVTFGEGGGGSGLPTILGGLEVGGGGRFEATLLGGPEGGPRVGGGGGWDFGTPGAGPNPRRTLPLFELILSVLLLKFAILFDTELLICDKSVSLCACDGLFCTGGGGGAVFPLLGPFII